LVIKFLITTLFVFCGLCSTQAGDRLLTFDNQPLGSKEEPLVLRTYVPDLGLDDKVMSHHHRGYESPRYSVKEAKDHPEKTYKLLMGLPAAIAINEGIGFSYVWDTLECRLIYAWEDGFLDMKDYWGDPYLGHRRSYGYTTKIYGKLYYQAAGIHPLSLDGKSLSNYKDLTYMGRRMEKQKPVFVFRVNGTSIEAKIEEGEEKQSVQISYQVIEGKGELKYKKTDKVNVQIMNPQSLVVKIQGSLIKDHPLRQEKVNNEVSAKKGEKLFSKMACNACHSIDGSKSHGPTLQDVFGSQRELQDGSTVEVTKEYLKKSIAEPNAQLAKGYPPNFMPTFGPVLKDPDLDSLVLFIQSVSNKE
jgi:cytochrome c2